MNNDKSIYKSRRETFMSKISNGAVIFASANPCRHRYRQDSNFYYLTGFDEPESIFIIAPDHPEHKFIMFVRPKDRQQEIWTGKRAGVEGAVQEYNADAAYPIADLEKEWHKYFENVENIYYTIGNNDSLDNKVFNLLKHFRGKRYNSCSGPLSIVDPAEIGRNMRVIKEQHEIELMRKAADISAEAHIALMKAIKPGMYEYEAQAILEYNFIKNGAWDAAYPIIAGAGTNATCLHYDTNNCILKDNELLLVDAGAEYHHYAADITRTFPVNGKFNPLQKDLYNLVLSAHKAAIEVMKPGHKMDEFHNKVLDVIVDGLMSMNLLKGNRDEIMEKKEYNKFYMHNSGHWLGLDTHDVGMTKQGDETRLLEPGMVLTIEPGLYINEDLDDISEEYKGLGIRIEDDVLVTANGNEVLTDKVPKKVQDIEELMEK